MIGAVARSLQTPTDSAEFKASDAGVIPSDWDAVPLAELGNFKNGVNKPAEDFGHGSPFVNLMDVFGVPQISSTATLGLVRSSRTEQGIYNLRKGDVLFVRSSVKPSGVGLTTVVSEYLPETVFSGFLIRFRDHGQLDMNFKRHCFAQTQFRQSLIASSSVSANTNINQSALARLSIALPPTLAEQQAIAEALSDADALIEGLESLIAKKRAIKQGAMQDLLTGKRRLPGFKGEWESLPFGRIAKIRNEKINTNGNARAEFCVELEHIGQGTGMIEGHADARDRIAIKYSFYPEDTLFGRLRPYLKKYWQAEREGVCSTEIWPLVPASVELHKHYLTHIVRTDQFVEAASAAYGTHMPRADWKGLSELKIDLPPSNDEQFAIASVLSDMDAEIEALDGKLAKARAVKQGMMQELLTGRVRLV